jgi:hypothetical protein
MLYTGGHSGPPPLSFRVDMAAHSFMPESSTQQSGPKARWRFWLGVMGVIFILYVIGYFPLMDRSRPTEFGAYSDYQSSFRWASPMPDHTGRPTKFPGTTVWNLIYEPMDALYFTLFPRSPQEVERLRAYGYIR